MSVLDIKLTKKVRRDAEKLMRKYKRLTTIIECRKMDLEHKLTPSYSGSESQRGNQFYSETEKLTMIEIELEELQRERKKLNLIYNTSLPLQQKIWDNRYILDRRDVEVYNELNIPDRTYYRLKRDLISDVAKAFGITEE